MLTSSAVPYFYLNQRDNDKRPIPVALSPERGQLIVALLRTKVSLPALIKGGARFDFSDLRGFDLRLADFSSTECWGCDFSFANLYNANFAEASLDQAVMNHVQAQKAQFVGASLRKANIANSKVSYANFAGADLTNAKITGSDVTSASFDRSRQRGLRLQEAKVENGFLPPDFRCRA